MKQAFCICVALVFGFCAFGAQKMTDQELDALVDKFVQCEHADFVQASIDELKAEGRLSESELAEAFYRGALRFKDRKEDGSRLNKSLFWLTNTLPENRLGELRRLAQTYPGSLGELSVWGLFKRTAERAGCLESMEDVIRVNPTVRSAVWRQFFTYLEKQDRLKKKTAFRAEIIGFAERRAEEALDAWSCDYILVHHLDGYAKSLRRKERLARILTIPEIRLHSELVEYFQHELNKMEPVGK